MRQLRVSAILLAAGLSTRFGERNKLLEPAAGVPCVTRVADVLVSAGLHEVIAVLGHQAGSVAATLPPGVRVILNPDYAQGMGSSIACGVRAACLEAEAFLIVPADMPCLGPETVTALLLAGPPAACALGDGISPPSLLPASARGDLEALSGDKGASGILRGLPGFQAIQVPEWQLQDLDTP